MILKNIILRTETFDYFKEQQSPFEIIRNYRQKESRWIEEDLFRENESDKIEKQIKELKGNTVNKMKQQQNPMKHLHQNDQIKIMKDESTRSLFSVNNGGLWLNNCQQKKFLYQEGFQGFSYPQIQGELEMKSHKIN